ncbi:MAG: hypothetical protein OSB43_17080 [Nocardioides sp.]|uniref:hypothetical protein n=1 Tax=Nocardioides sp. TaxID=35761 RepID=UPI000C981CDB|nr:hypothetical protein [Nocardioides sp.]MAS54615.1 hypothetical protein [Pimelobacter sp.]MDE0777993.1 hypothetical protein [Nocardioides sp.]
MDDTTPIADTPIRTQADLEAFWRRLMEPLGFSDGTLWVLAIGGDDLPTPTLLEVVDEGVQPTPEEAIAFGAFLAHLSADVPDGSRWAFLRSRPGRGGPTAADRALVAGLVAGCRDAGVPTEVVHLATDDTLVPLPYDELARSA